jgi:hypothetical protein
VADGEGAGLGVSAKAVAGAAKAVAGAASERDNTAAQATGRRHPAIFFNADTPANVPGARREVAPYPSRCGPPPGERPPETRDTDHMLCSSGGQPPDPRPLGSVPGARRSDERHVLVKLSRPISWFLLAFGVWSWVIWITFVKNLWKDGSGLAFDNAGNPTAYFWVHLTLAVVSFVLGTVIGVIGLRGLRALRRTS